MQHWQGFCRLTHTGYQQIGLRLTPEGLGHGYLADALDWADVISLVSLVEFAKEMANDRLLAEAQQMARRLAGKAEAEM